MLVYMATQEELQFTICLTPRNGLKKQFINRSATVKVIMLKPKIPLVLEVVVKDVLMQSIISKIFDIEVVDMEYDNESH